MPSGIDHGSAGISQASPPTPQERSWIVAAAFHEQEGPHVEIMTLKENALSIALSPSVTEHQTR